MKYLLALLMLAQAAAAQELPSMVKPFPSEDSSNVPTVAPKANSEIEATVKEAGRVDETAAGVADPAPTSTGSGAGPFLRSTKQKRDHSTGTVLVGYQLITSWLPSKKTVSYTHIFNENWSVELEYAWSSLSDPVPGVELGEISEKRFTLAARRYFGNSFHVLVGPYYNKFDAELGGSILNNVSNTSDVGFKVEGLGLATGVGNRWQWKSGFTLGVDWARINIPLVETKVEDRVLGSISDSGDRGDVRDVISAFNNIPTFVLFGVNLGYTF